ncbi:MAG: Dihydrolipoyllysine-residue acetyltransferase component of pyruvate dehydrogenase complex [Smithella sp. PtaU1.Bin162]|nr:MAG: Dihydrolipoyllysine-residue acetyltransferase component of pyruvate dehydrogenase complex [Smithella sp. PtaU1.Bin162]
MPVDIVMPKLGLTMTEGILLEWKKKEGEAVKKGDVLFILETEKVTYEVEAPDDGIMGKILVQEKETVPVGATVALLLKAGEDTSALKIITAPADVKVSAGVPVAPAAPVSSAAAVSGTRRIKATPLAKKMARILCIDLGGVRGTGSAGRIVREDVEKAQKEKTEKPAVPSVNTADGEAKIVPFTGMRRTIAKKMLASKVESAQAYMGNTIDATRIQELRKALLPRIENKCGVRITITDIIMKITGAALLEHPVINTRWTDKGVLFLPDVHMGMAMALDEGLIVPVIRDINKKTYGQIAADRVQLIQKGKNNKFLPDDIKGGTFTLSAMGMFGLETFTAIINQPENAILAVGAIIETPVVVAGTIVVRPMMKVNLTYDHRAIDGAEAGKFMRTLKELLEEPSYIQ